MTHSPTSSPEDRSRGVLVWIRKLHIYAGLLAFTACMVWGVTGVRAAFLPAQGGGGDHAPVEVRTMAWTAPVGVGDDRVAIEAVKSSRLRFVGRPQNVKRDAQGILEFAVLGPNGRRGLTYFAGESRLRLEVEHGGLGEFLSVVHAMSPTRGPPDTAARVWGWYNELSVWALLFMSVSGVYLWLATRPKLTWVWATLTACVAATTALWILLR